MKGSIVVRQKIMFVAWHFVGSGRVEHDTVIAISSRRYCSTLMRITGAYLSEHLCGRSLDLVEWSTTVNA
jgi:hypothetical protein